MTETVISLCWLVLTVFLVTLSQTISADLLACNLPRNVIVKAANGQQVNIYGIDLSVGIKTDDISILGFPRKDLASIIIDDTAVQFKGNIIIESRNHDTTSKPQEIVQIYSGRSWGTAHLAKGNVDDYAVQNCRMFFSSKNNTRNIAIPEVEHEIRRLTESCLGPQVCQSIGIVDSTQLFNSNEYHRLGSSTTVSESSVISSFKDYERVFNPVFNFVKSNTSTKVESLEPFQSFVNLLMDVTLKDVTEKLVKENESSINIPNIEKKYSEGRFFITRGHFKATGGTFTNLTDLKRTKDVVLSKNGQKWTLSLGFELPNARLSYSQYTLQQRHTKIDGKLSGQVSGVELTTNISIDYNQFPCTKQLEEFRVTNLGKLQITVTGLNSLKSRISKIQTWMNDEWRDNVVRTIQDRLLEIALDKLTKFDCERYRL